MTQAVLKRRQSVREGLPPASPAGPKPTPKSGSHLHMGCPPL